MASSAAPGLFDACEALCRRPVIAGVTLRTREAGRPATWGETDVLIRTGEGEPLEGPAEAFSQANDAVNEKLVEAVIELAEPEGLRVLELHCGIGNFTAGLAARAKTLIAVEQDPRAVEACQRNLRRRGLKARVAVGDASHPPKGRYDVVVLDPPRQGARAFFEDSHVLPGPKRLIYVSSSARPPPCDGQRLPRRPPHRLRHVSPDGPPGVAGAPRSRVTAVRCVAQARRGR
ncbi:MAG: methyltransferase [Deltaproteobacteria bacterium]|nr:methyltransferase [Deltaproteobacteria bacterium]